MGLFSSTGGVPCSVCGMRISGVPARGVVLCTKCKSKVSPYIENPRSMTPEEMLEHVKYRDANQSDLQWFQPTRILLLPTYDTQPLYGVPVYVDENNGLFLFSESGDYINENADLFDFSDFRSFSYTEECTGKYAYINVALRVFYRPGNFEIEETYRIPCELPFKYRGKPGQYNVYQEKLAEVQNTKDFFEYMIGNPSEAPISDDGAVNLACPNCGGITAATGPTVNCEYCGLTFANEYYREETHDTQEAPNAAAATSNVEYDDNMPFADDEYDAYKSYSESRGTGFNYSSININTGGTNSAADNLVNHAGSRISGGFATPVGKQVGNRLAQRATNAAGRAVAGHAANTVGRAAAGHVANTAGRAVAGHVANTAGRAVAGHVANTAGRAVAGHVASTAGRAVAGHVANTAGRAVARTAAQTAGRAVARTAAQTAGRAVARSAAQTAGRAVARSAAQTAGRAVARTAAQTAGRAAAKTAGHAVAKSAGKAIAKGALRNLGRFL